MQVQNTLQCYNQAIITAKISDCTLKPRSKHTHTYNHARNQGGAFGACSPPKFSKHCMAILTFVAKDKDEILYSNHF